MPKLHSRLSMPSLVRPPKPSGPRLEPGPEYRPWPKTRRLSRKAFRAGPAPEREPKPVLRPWSGEGLRPWPGAWFEARRLARLTIVPERLWSKMATYGRISTRWATSGFRRYQISWAEAELFDKQFAKHTRMPWFHDLARRHADGIEETVGKLARIATRFCPRCGLRAKTGLFCWYCRQESKGSPYWLWRPQDSLTSSSTRGRDTRGRA